MPKKLSPGSDVAINARVVKVLDERKAAYRIEGVAYPVTAAIQGARKIMAGQDVDLLAEVENIYEDGRATVRVSGYSAPLMLRQDIMRRP